MINRFADPAIGKRILEEIRRFGGRATIMEVCGTHTVAIFRAGIRDGLPETVNLVSGPGCPVCVTPVETVEKAVRLSFRKNTTLFCFGDMMRVPAANGTIESAISRGASVRMMYSPMEALEHARENPQVDTILFGIGFETTIPLFASVLMRAQEEDIRNLYLLCAFKLIPPALHALLSSEDAEIDGFMLPGHVSTIIGEDAYRFLETRYRVPAVITGFEPVDILKGIAMLIQLIEKGIPEVRNEYSRFVSKQGNPKAQETIHAVFTECDASWRGLGTIPASGLALKNGFSRFDAEALVDFDIPAIPERPGCLCGEVIKGKKKPIDCKLYGTVCTPSRPIGPCMVSSEGTCAAFYKYAFVKKRGNHET